MQREDGSSRDRAFFLLCPEPASPTDPGTLFGVDTRGDTIVLISLPAVVRYKVIDFHTDTSPPMVNFFTQCSGAIIGPNSAISAAHCFFNPTTGTWKNFQYGAPGFDSLHSPNEPWGHFNCFSIWMFSAFFTDTHVVSQWDIAAFDFTGCTDNPTSTGVGWFGYIINPNPSGRTLATDGYASNLSCALGQVCGMTGTAVNSGSALLLSSNLFLKGGMSGGPIFTTNTNQIMGNSIAVDTNTSYYRRFDTTVYNLFHSLDPTRFP
jgi:V8-like Glu-specific endopeptidase